MFDIDKTIIILINQIDDDNLILKYFNPDNLKIKIYNEIY